MNIITFFFVNYYIYTVDNIYCLFLKQSYELHLFFYYDLLYMKIKTKILESKAL